MSTAEDTRKVLPRFDELHDGDRMTQAEFHRRYLLAPKDFHAELIGGVVYVASPLGRPHGTRHARFTTFLGNYEGLTPGTEVGDNTTVILGEQDEPQPDVYLRVLPEYGGQSHDTIDEYVGGAPELVGEIADSSHAIDLGEKRVRYAAAGVIEYIVVNLRQQQLRWFDLRGGQEFAADAEGVFRSRIFPGLWLHGPALIARDFPVLMATLNQGLSTPEHAAFVQGRAGQRKL